MPLSYLALGSNLGDPLEQLRQARAALEGLGRIVATSSFYRTAPVGGPPGQPDYLNAVILLEPQADDPETLLQELLALEAQQGRVRAVRWDARTLDLDMLAWDDVICESATLALPHPRMLTRAFVLAPLCEIAPEWRHPKTGERGCEVLRRLGLGGVARTALSWAVADTR